MSELLRHRELFASNCGSPSRICRNTVSISAFYKPKAGASPRPSPEGKGDFNYDYDDDYDFIKG